MDDQLRKKIDSILIREKRFNDPDKSERIADTSWGKNGLKKPKRSYNEEECKAVREIIDLES